MNIVRISLLTVFFVLSTLASPASEPIAGALQECINYEPTEVALEGTILRRAFLNASDQKEVVWILRLEKPVCVNADEGNDFNVGRSRVTDVQLVLEAQMFSKYRRMLGKRVRTTGTLFGEHTVHHFTPVLLDVTAVDLVR